MKGILFKPWKIKLISEMEPDDLMVSRRVIKPQPLLEYKGLQMQYHKKPCYQVGEVVYIKEAWYHRPDGGVSYKMDFPDAKPNEFWTPLFMPAWAARYFIQTTDVQPERLQLPLSSKELRLEGGEAALVILTPLNSKWVWRYEFKKVEK